MDDLAHLASRIPADALRCLQHIAAVPLCRLSPFDNYCSAESIQCLQSLGLIEAHSSAWLPLEMKHACYRTSQLGDALLRFLTN